MEVKITKVHNIPNFDKYNKKVIIPKISIFTDFSTKEEKLAYKKAGHSVCNHIDGELTWDYHFNTFNIHIEFLRKYYLIYFRWNKTKVV